MIVCLSMVYLKSATEVHLTCGDAFLIELEFSSVGLCGEGKTRVHVERCFGARKEPITNSTHTRGRERESNFWIVTYIASSPLSPLLPNVIIISSYVAF